MSKRKYIYRIIQESPSGKLENFALALTYVSACAIYRVIHKEYPDLKTVVLRYPVNPKFAFSLYWEYEDITETVCLTLDKIVYEQGETQKDY